jgi:hypothetical protein
MFFAFPSLLVREFLAGLNDLILRQEMRGVGTCIN